MEKVLSILKSTKILGIVGAALLIIGNFFNFATVKVSLLGLEHSVTFLEGDGKFVLALGFLALVIIFIDLIINKFPNINFLQKLRNQKLTLISAIISAIIIFIDAGDAFEYGDAGLGFYMLVLGVIALAAYPFLYKGNE